jgi:hypothetical protein
MSPTYRPPLRRRQGNVLVLLDLASIFAASADGNLPAAVAGTVISPRTPPVALSMTADPGAATGPGSADPAQPVEPRRSRRTP